MRSLAPLIVAVSLGATHAVYARTHHHAPRAAAATTNSPDAKIPAEKNRDPADIALDHRIKGICKGC
jgi:hypothetical protein